MEGSKTYGDAMRLTSSVLYGKATGLNGIPTVFKSLDGSKTRVDASIDSTGNREINSLDGS